jgi:hypothetical protein
MNAKAHDSDRLRADLIDAARAQRRVIVSSTRKGKPCVAVGRITSVSDAHIVMATTREDVMVLPLDSIEAVEACNPPPRPPVFRDSLEPTREG